jgi:hypothetical protein
MKEAPSWADTLPTHRIPAALAAEAASETVAACARQSYRETAVVLDADGTTIAKPEKATKQELAIEGSGMDLFVARPLASTCSMPLSSFGSTAETSSGSTPQRTRRQSGLHVK